MNNFNDVAYEYIKNKIINIEIKPGEKIFEKKIAKELNMSTTPIKQALYKLEEEKFVIISPRKSCVVTNIELKLIKDIFQTRLRIEPLLMEFTLLTREKTELKKELNILKNNFIKLKSKSNLSGKDFDDLYDKFKLFFSKNCGNQFFEHLSLIIYSHLTRIRKFLYGLENRRLEAIDEHILIIDKILNDDPIDEIKNMVYDHVVSAQNDFFKNLEILNI